MAGSYGKSQKTINLSEVLEVTVKYGMRQENITFFTKFGNDWKIWELAGEA